MLYAMKISELQELFIDNLKTFISNWKFVKSQRHFKLKRGDINWLFHITCINHASDFDAVGDVAIEFLSAKRRICIIGAEVKTAFLS